MSSNPLAEIDIVEVAKIAASIPTPNLQPIEKIRLAYELLAVAHKARAAAKFSGRDPLWILQSSNKPEEQYPVAIELNEIKGRYGWQVGSNSFAIPFEDCLKLLMPNCGKAASRKNRFIDFLRSDPCLSLSQKAVAQEISKLETTGATWGAFENYFFIFREWWPRQKSKAKSRAGQAKGKQGRVIRKNDKRKGSRAGCFLKALKKTS